MKCLKCGHDLTEMRRELIGFHLDVPEPDCPWDNWSYSHTEYAGHCPNCLCDWEWSEYFVNGQSKSTQPTRIFWG